MIFLILFSLANQKILELEKKLEEGQDTVIHQSLGDLQEQLCVAQGEREGIISQLEEREVALAEYSMYMDPDI
jgi:hypothetical protein